MNSDSELVVVEAAGAKPRDGAQTGSGAVSRRYHHGALVSNFVEPWSNRKLYDVIAQAQSDLFSVAVRSGTS
jgi:lipopolysaccharide export system permease protein